jgi:hypothetical protein
MSRAVGRPFSMTGGRPVAPAMPWTMPPSICCLTMSGLTMRPQSTAATARRTRTRCSGSISISTS